MSLESRLESLLARWQELRDTDQTVSAADLCRDCPDLTESLQRAIDERDSPPTVLPSVSGDDGPPTRVSTIDEASAALPLPPLPSGPPTARVPGYQILEVLGRGAMGIVYKARQLRLNRVVALKMILHGDHAGPDECLRFLTEAEAIAAVRHSGIVGIYEFGSHDGRPFLALEYCAGGTLAKRLAGKPLPPREAARLIEQVSRAVQAAHELGIIHRDLKPANVLLTSAGAPETGSTLPQRRTPAVENAPETSDSLAALTPRVSDFGLARRLENGSGLTATGAVMGTPSYMPPEQAVGSKDVGTPADVYSLGAILYECLTGRPPFLAANAAETLRQVISEEPLAPRSLNRGLPRDLETIALKCLNKDARKRYESAAVLADDLRRWQNGEPIAARPAGSLERVVKWARRRPTAATALACGVLAGVLLLGLSLFALQQWREARLNLAGLKEEKRVREEEQRQRALAQVERLCEAAPAAVPAILARLEDNREVVLPRLHELYAAPDCAPARRMRLALALLPAEPDAVVDWLAEWMLTAEDPAEMLLVRDGLKVRGDELAGWLWEQAKAPDPARRFRALVALAEYDPHDERWRELGGVAANEVLTAIALHLGTWVRALVPVRSSLLPHLNDAFRARDAPEQRLAAAIVLAGFLADQPETLAERMLDADARQAAVLRPLLRNHREVSTRRLTAALAAPLDYWKDAPLDAAWTKPGPDVTHELEQAGGLLAERFALCQSLPLSRVPDVTEALRASGYRPVTVRPWAKGVALVWTRDGREWQLETALTLEKLKQRDAHWQKAGLIPADVAAYATAQGDRFAALWQRGDKGETGSLYAGVAAARHRADLEALMEAKQTPFRLQALTSADGDVSYAGVWRKGPRSPVRWNLRTSRAEISHADSLLDLDNLLIDVHVGPAGKRAPATQSWRADLQRARADASKDDAQSSPHYYEGLALFKLQRDDEAMAAFDAYFARSKTFWAHGYRAQMHARAGRAEKAREALAAYNTVNDEPIWSVYHAALIDVYLGAESRGLKRMEEAVKADPTDGYVAYRAACVYARASEQTRTHRAAWAAGLAGAPKAWAALAVAAADRSAEYRDRSVALLSQAVAAGYRNLTALHVEADLEPIRESAGYREFVKRTGETRHYASVWGDDVNFESRGVSGLSPEAHLKRCRQLVAEGFRPVSLSLNAIPGERDLLAASVWQRPALPLSERQEYAKRQASAATSLLELDQSEEVWPLFRHSPDPTIRSYLLWHLGQRRYDPRLLIARLDRETDVSARRALILALGEYSDLDLPASLRKPLVPKLLAWYRDDPDPGIHAAIDWLLRHAKDGAVARRLDWGQAVALERIDKELAGKQPRLKTAGWSIDSQGQTLVRIAGPVEFRMGSSHWEQHREMVNEPAHVKRIPRSFAIATKPVTVAQWQRFLAEKGGAIHSLAQRYSPDANGPIIYHSMYDAMRYCNWLSDKEGLPPEQWCYPEKIEPGMKLPADYLGRTGYRLPTEAEWEYACRAGTHSSRYLGSSIELSPRYGHFQDNSQDRAWPVGQKRPNDLGMFDMLGNVWERCQNRWITPPPRLVEDREERGAITSKESFVYRGVSFRTISAGVRTTSRNSYSPGGTGVWLGFRVARTGP